MGAENPVPSMRQPRVLILYNEPVLPAGHPDYESEHEILYTVDVVNGHLLKAGFEVSKLGVSKEVSVLVSGLDQHQPDVIFNLFEGTGEHGQTEAYVAG